MPVPEGAQYGEAMSKARAWMSWSSGKDSALALHTVRAEGELEVVGLVTTVNTVADRVAMHAVRRSLLEAQAEVLGLPLHVVELPWPCPNEVYEQQMTLACGEAAKAGVSHMIFGDLFLEDIRAYREQSLREVEMTAVFPLWQRSTMSVAAAIIEAGIRAVVTCVDPSQAPAALAGRHFDAQLLADLPEGVDPCGENGEFHTLVYDSPDFRRPLAVAVGDVVARDGFVFADVEAAPDTASHSPV